MAEQAGSPKAGASRKAVIIGGSMAGVFSALYLLQRGWQVELFERSPVPIEGRGAGITTHPEMFEALNDLGCRGDDLGIPFAWRYTFDQSGEIIARLHEPQVATSWFRLFAILYEKLPAGCYHLGKDLVGIDQRADAITARFADGSTATGDIVIGADGFRSSVRAQIMPHVEPVYAGYVGWRGLAEEKRFSPAVREQIIETFSFYLPPGEQILGYPAVGLDNDPSPGHRCWNIVWYRPTDIDTELPRLLTDDSGHRHEISIPPPLISKRVIAELRADSERLLPPQFREAMDIIDQPFFQPIYDFESPRMSDRRACVVGDAAFVVRPHVGGGVVKAAMDAKALARVLDETDDVVSALQAYNAERQPKGSTFVQQGRKLGSYIRRSFASKAERQAAMVHADPQAVMAETALLAFARG